MVDGDDGSLERIYPKLMDLRAALAEVPRLLEHQAPKEPSINGEI
jgi:hypothetical protein